MPDARTVLPAPILLDLIGIRAAENAITLAARSSSQVARSPACGTRFARVHSHYTRMLANLPWQGIPVTVRLRLRRFFCDQKSCNQAIFAEPLPSVATRWWTYCPTGVRTPSPDGLWSIQVRR
jgi:transposase